MDPHQYAYGHGRRSVFLAWSHFVITFSNGGPSTTPLRSTHCRICPGRFFADETLALMCASVLHLFNIKPPMDESGKPKKIEYKVTNDTPIS